MSYRSKSKPDGNEVKRKEILDLVQQRCPSPRQVPSQGCNMYVLWQAWTFWTSLPLEERDRQKHPLAPKVKSKHQLAVGVNHDEDSSEYEYDFDLSVVSIHAMDDQKSREVFAPVQFHPKDDNSPSYEIRGKVDTGAMVSYMPTSMLSKIGLSKKDLKSSSAIIRVMSRVELQNCELVEISVTYNDITAKSRFYVTKQECAFILGLGFCKEFKLVTIAPVCIQQSI